ncbi:MAG: DUF748 domain-containing protein [Desulfoprunum sp.]|nr:DUF748 domain-containing protein [Desulfoprunum sp.]
MSDHFGNISITPPVPAKPAPKSATKPTPKPASQPVKLRSRNRPERPKPAKKTKWKKPYLYALLLLALLPILYSIAGFWLIPLYIGKALPEKLADQTGMRLTLDNVAFNPFSYTFSLQGLKLNSSHAGPESQNLLAIDKIEADLAPLSLLRNNLVSNALRIVGLDLNIIRAQDNHYNLEELLNGKGPGPSSDIMSFSELPFLFSLNNISIRESKITFQDTPSAATHTLEQIELDLPTLSNFPFQVDDYIHPRFSTVINGSKIELTGQAAMPGSEGKDGLKTKLSCNIHALDLPLYSKYLPASLPLLLTKGMADGNLQFDFTRDATKGAKIVISFTGEIVDMELTDKENSFAINLPATTIAGNVLPMSGALHIQNIAIRQPHCTARNTPTIENLIRLAPILGRSTAKTSAGKLPASIDIDSLHIEDGDLTLYKENEKTPAAVWTSLQFSIKDFSSVNSATQPTKKGSFSVSGEKKDSSMAFSWQGTFNDNDVPEGLFRLDNIPAATFFSGIGVHLGTVGAGTANLQGKLSLAIKDSAQKELVTNLTESEINLQGLTLLSDKAPWLDAPILKFTGFSKNGSRVDFGGLRLESGSLTLHSEKLPEIFKEFAAKDSRISLNSIDFNGKITVLGKTEKPLTLSSVLLQATNLQAKTANKETLIFSAKINENGIIKAKGTARLAPFQATLSSGFSGIAAQTLLPWFSNLPLLTKAQATISGKGILTIPGTSFSGQLRLDNAVFTDDKTPLLSWNTADLQGFSYTATPFHLGISLMEIAHPVMTWQRAEKDASPGEKFGSFLQSLLPEKEKVSAQTKESISISQLDIQEIRLKNGEIHYNDNRLSPPWAAEISQFDGLISALHSSQTKEQSRFALSGHLNATPFSVEGSADFFSNNMAGQSTFKISEFPLSSFQQYLPQTLGLDGSQGTFSLELSSLWNNANLTHKARFLFNDIHPESTAEDTALTLALLKNADQQVELSVTPVHTSQETGTPILVDTLTAFQRQLIKAKVSPLLLASGDYTDLVGNEFADFQPGGFILAEKGQKILSRFSTFLAAHTSVGVRITGCADRLVDGNALKKQLEDIEATRVSKENARRKTAWQHERDLEQERQRTQQQTGSKQGSTKTDLPAQVPNDYTPVYPEPMIIEESMLVNLARQRAARVQALLTEKLGLDPARVTVTAEPKVTAEPNNPGNRALISLSAFTPTKNKPAAQESPGQ